VEYSKKHGFEFGFSIQKQIYVECGGNLDFSDPSSKTWDEFYKRTTWKSDGKWVDYPDPFFNNNLMYVKGHLPMWFGFGCWVPGGFVGVRAISYLVSRLVKCKA